MVGDHPLGDIAGAQGASIQAIHTRQFVFEEPLDVAADHTIDRLAEILPLLLG
jgi:FMN phosphatase YigB (HAD superfamily)